MYAPLSHLSPLHGLGGDPKAAVSPSSKEQVSGDSHAEAPLAP